MTQKSNTTLFWVLVVGIFFVIFLLWFPNFVGSIKTLDQSLQEGSKQTSELRSEWSAKSEEVKKTFDSFLQQQTTLLNTASNSPEGEVSPQNSSGTITNEVLK